MPLLKRLVDWPGGLRTHKPFISGVDVGQGNSTHVTVNDASRLGNASTGGEPPRGLVPGGKMDTILAKLLLGSVLSTAVIPAPEILLAQLLGAVVGKGKIQQIGPTEDTTGTTTV